MQIRNKKLEYGRWHKLNLVHWCNISYYKFFFYDFRLFLCCRCYGTENIHLFTSLVSSVALWSRKVYNMFLSDWNIYHNSSTEEGRTIRLGSLVSMANYTTLVTATLGKIRFDYKNWLRCNAPSKNLSLALLIFEFKCVISFSVISLCISVLFQDAVFKIKYYVHCANELEDDTISFVCVIPLDFNYWIRNRKIKQCTTIGLPCGWIFMNWW